MKQYTNSLLQVTAAAVLAVINCGWCSGQTTAIDRQIIRSFTEPSYKSVSASSVPGIIAEAFVTEGDRVSVGDPLATINRKVLQATLAIAEAKSKSTARLDAATSQWKMLKSQLHGIEALIEGGHTNRYELEQKQSEHQRAFSEYQAAKDDLNLAQLEVKRIQAEIEARTIRSPIDGYVIEIHKKLGENVSSNEPQFATIVNISKLKTRFYLDAATLFECRAGDFASVLIGPGQQRRVGTITYVSPVINSDSGLGRLDVLIDNKDLRLQSGIVAIWNGKTHQPSESGVPKTVHQNTGAATAQPASASDRFRMSQAQEGRSNGR